MIWRIRPSAEIFNEVAKNTLVEHLGIEFGEVGDDFIRATMPVDHRTKQPVGLLHGGASVALAETLGSMASILCIDDPGAFSVVGLEINANHLMSVKGGIETGTARPIRLGRRIHVWHVEIAQDENLICVSRLTVMVVANQD